MRLLFIEVAVLLVEASAFLSQNLALLSGRRSPSLLESSDLDSNSARRNGVTCYPSTSRLQVALSTPFLSWRNETSPIVSDRPLYPSPAAPYRQQQQLALRPLEQSRSQGDQRQLAFHVYCDLDGVLVDFERGIRTIFPTIHQGIQINDIHRPTMWQRVASTGSFFESLPWTSDGRRLWDAIRLLQPDVLTGVPTSYHDARAQKVRWCERELGCSVSHVDMAGHMLTHMPVNGGKRRRSMTDSNVDTDDGVRIMNVITCWSHNKHHESGPGRVLIDDCKRLEDAWVAKGGIFIHHRGDVDKTIGKLYDHGILGQ